jgi:hypothetical protein
MKKAAAKAGKGYPRFSPERRRFIKQKELDGPSPNMQVSMKMWFRVILVLARISMTRGMGMQLARKLSNR